jgi:hypothetical protein
VTAGHQILVMWTHLAGRDPGVMDSAAARYEIRIALGLDLLEIRQLTGAGEPSQPGEGAQ